MSSRVRGIFPWYSGGLGLRAVKGVKYYLIISTVQKPQHKTNTRQPENESQEILTINKNEINTFPLGRQTIHKHSASQDNTQLKNASEHTRSICCSTTHSLSRCPRLSDLPRVTSHSYRAPGQMPTQDSSSSSCLDMHEINFKFPCHRIYVQEFQLSFFLWAAPKRKPDLPGCLQKGARPGRGRTASSSC